jgi:hypothetical protein
MKSTKFGFVKIAAHVKASQVLTPILMAIAAIGLISGLNACGSGAVGAPPDTTPVASTPLAVSPPTADLFPDVPTTFTITGGKPGYSAFSSNNVVLPVTATLPGATFTVIPGPVTAETVVDITVKDAANASASAKATVKPTTLNNQITFTPFAPTATGCGTNAICSGGDAQVVVKAALNGVVLRNRAIRFDAFQGNFQFVTPGSDALVPSLSINTDDQGEASARLRVGAGVPTQVATLQTTDVASGLARRYNFNIVQQTDGKGILSVLPSSGITIKGAKGILGQNSGQGTCGVGTAIIFYVFGGTSPYSAASPQPSVAVVSQPIAATDGTSFRSEVRDCGKIAFIITDSAGRTIETAALEIQRGDPAETPVAASLIVRPEALELVCGGSGSISLAGSGTFTIDTVPANIGANVSLSPTFGDVPIVLSPTITVARAAKGAAPADIVLNINSGATTTKLKLTVPASCS